MSGKLKPCPAEADGCGGTDCYVRIRIQGGCTIYCPDCDIETPVYPTEQAAIRDWNNRPAGQVEGEKLEMNK